MNRNIRSLTKLGGKSIGLTLPIDIVRKLAWKARQKVIVKYINGGVTIKLI